MKKELEDEKTLEPQTFLGNDRVVRAPDVDMPSIAIRDFCGWFRTFGFLVLLDCIDLPHNQMMGPTNENILKNQLYEGIKSSSLRVPVQLQRSNRPTKGLVSISNAFPTCMTGTQSSPKAQPLTVSSIKVARRRK